MSYWPYGDGCGADRWSSNKCKHFRSCRAIAYLIHYFSLEMLIQMLLISKQCYPLNGRTWVVKRYILYRDIEFKWSVQDSTVSIVNRDAIEMVISQNAVVFQFCLGQHLHIPHSPQSHLPTIHSFPVESQVKPKSIQKKSASWTT